MIAENRSLILIMKKSHQALRFTLKTRRKKGFKVQATETQQAKDKGIVQANN